jgi:hypothetical protein
LHSKYTCTDVSTIFISSTISEWNLEMNGYFI